MKSIPVIQDQLKTDIPKFAVGDTVKVHNRIKEGEKERIQIFEGVVIARHKREGIGANFIVRRISNGVGVERTFMLHSPNVLKVEVLREGSVRRAKLFYLRDTKSSSMKIKEKKTYHKKSEKVTKKVSKKVVKKAVKKSAPLAEKNS